MHKLCHKTEVYQIANTNQDDKRTIINTCYKTLF